MTVAAIPIDPTAPLVARLRDDFGEDLLRDFVDGETLSVPDALWEQAILGPLTDFLSRPGKEFRAHLVEISWALSGGKSPVPEELTLIVEVLHAGSLIVDDIEDHSTTRRGQPALHLLYGLPTALNAGNWLYFWAFALLERAGLPAPIELRLHRLLTSTMLRCHQGQALDLNAHMAHLTKRDVRGVVETTTRLKTGCLMGLAASIGAVAQGASPQQEAVLHRFGNDLGLCLQMLDDRSGLESPRRVDKGHEDLLLGRPTWPWAWLAEHLDDVSFAHLQSQARRVERADLHPEVLAEAMRSHLGDLPRRAVRNALERSFTPLERTFACHRHLATVRAELTRLEHSYE